jgi:hypothetical protein
MKTLSRLISVIFHPLLFPTYGALLLLVLNPTMFGFFGERLHIVWLIIVFALTVVFPTVWILMMKGLGMIDSLDIKTPSQRIVPFIAVGTFYLWATWMFKSSAHMKIPSNRLIYYMMMGASLSLFTAFFLNIWTRISLHTIGIGSILGVLLIMVRISPFDLRPVFIVTILLAGIIGTARLLLDENTETEVLAGYFIGFIGQFLSFFLISKFL